MIATASRRLLAAPLLDKTEERALFREMSQLKAAAAGTRQQAGAELTAAQQRAVDRQSNAARAIRNRIAEANMRLVISVARPFVTAGHSLEDLISEGTVPLLRSVELFDVTTGHAFSTYASHALRNHYYRILKRHARRTRLIGRLGSAALAEIPDERRAPLDASAMLAHTRQVAADLVRGLSERERFIIATRFGLDGNGSGHSFSEIARSLRLSKERVRVLANEALSKLRIEAERQGVEPLEWN